MPVAEHSSQALSRREQRRAERNDAILDIAHAMFLERGYAETTMSAIAARLGGSKATLWTHFPTKQSLFAAVLARAAGSLESQLLASLKLEEGIDRSISHFCRTYAQIICSRESIALHRLVIAEGVRFPEIGRTFFDSAIRTTQQILSLFLADAARDGFLTIPDPLAAANLLRSLCHGNTFQSLILNATTSPCSSAIDNDAHIAATAFLRMFAPP